MSHNSAIPSVALINSEVENRLNIIFDKDETANFDLFGVPVKKELPVIDLRPLLPKMPPPLPTRKIDKRHALPVVADIINIRPSYCTIYGERQDGNQTARFMDNMRNLQRAGASQVGEKSVSKKAKLNIRCAIDWLVMAAKEKDVIRSADNTRFKFKINFVTLTLPCKQIHSDKQIKDEVLGHFLEKLRRNYGLKNYIWKAEPQKNGNIHFHLVTDTFIHYSKVQSLWNDSLEKLKYISRYEQNRIIQYGVDAPNRRNPPSTQVKSVVKIRKLAAYLSKYLTKESTVRKIKGRQWYLSESLQGIKSLKMYASDVDDEFRTVYNNLAASAKKSFDYCMLLLVSAEVFITNGCSKIAKKIFDFLEPLRMPDDNVIHIV